jgi:hypothetical protein
MATFYVATTGNDANNGTSPALAKRNVSAGLGLLAGGDTLIIGAGTYNDAVANNVPSGSSWGAPTRIQAAAGTTVWLAPTSGAFVVFFQNTVQFIEFDGINLDSTRGITAGCVLLRGWSGGNPNHIRFKNAEIIGPTNGVINEGLAASNCFDVTNDVGGLIGSNEFLNLTIHGCGDAGDYSAAFVIGTPDNVVDGCNVYDTSGVGIYFYSNQSQNTNNIARNNFVHDITRSGSDYIVGIDVGAGAGCQVYNNVVYNLTGLNAGSNAGILTEASVTGCLMYSNTVTQNTSMYGLKTTTGVSGNTIENNILYSNTGATNLQDDAASTQVTNLVGVNPVFVSPSTNNFNLTVGSPAIDAGTPNAVAPNDITGRVRTGNFDIGAYEFVPPVVVNDLWAASVM